MRLRTQKVPTCEVEALKVLSLGVRVAVTLCRAVTEGFQLHAADSAWNSVTYGEGLFVAVATGGGSRVMTSPDGINWTARSAAAANGWLLPTETENLLQYLTVVMAIVL